MQQSLYCLGSNYFGQLGLSKDGSDYIKRTHIISPFPLNCDRIKHICCGSTFTVVVLMDGTIHMTGTLNGVVNPVLTQITVSYSLSCTQVAAGRKHVLALMQGGFVLSWGMGYFGQLGHGDETSWEQPRLVHGLKPNELGAPVISLSSGAHHCAALTSEGRIFMWGLNRNAQCGTGTKSDVISSPRPVDQSSLVWATRISCGRNHTAAIGKKGQVFTWGASGYGRLGIMNTPKTLSIPTEIQLFNKVPVKDICCGDFHSLALTEAGSVYSWGCGNIVHPYSMPIIVKSCKYIFFCRQRWANRAGLLVQQSHTSNH